MSEKSPNIRPFEEFEPTIDPTAWIDSSAVVIGNVTLGRESSIWPNCTVRGDINKIVIGDESNVQDNSCLHVSHDSSYMPGGAALIIGDQVTIGHSVTLHGCQIGNQCLIGMTSLVMDKAVIEDQVILGAGSLVPVGKTLESGYLYVGRPAKRVRKLTAEELAYLEYSAGNYVRLAKRHRD